MIDPRSIAALAAIRARARALPHLRRSGALLAMASALALTVGMQDARANGGANGKGDILGGADNPIGPGGAGSGNNNGGSGGGAGTTGGAGGVGTGLGGNGGAGGAHGYVGDPLPGSPAAGTDGQAGASADFWGGGGGAGGYGAVITGSGALGTLSVNVTGGNGGNGGNGATYAGGSGGSGGVGLWINATDGASLMIAGQVQGGAGGAVGSGNTFFGVPTAGAGGAGIVGQNLSLTIGSTGSVAGGSGADAIRFTGGANTLSLDSGATLTGNIAVTGALDLAQASNFTLANAISGTGSLSKSGTGTLTLSGVNLYSGDTTVSAGTLALSGAGSIASSSGVMVAAGATLDISGATTGATIKALSGAGDVALGSKALTVDQAVDATFAGGISGTAGLSKSGTGTLTLSSVNLYSGATTVNAGSLVLSGAGSIAGSSGVTVASGATLDISGATTGATIKALSGAGGVALGSKALTVDQAANATFAGDISGTGSLSKSGTGTLTLSGVNLYSGDTTVSAGSLALSGAGSIAGSSGVAVANGATLDISAATTGATIKALSGAGEVALGSKALTVDQAVDATFAGGISGTAGLTKSGTGTLTLSGVNLYSGDTAVSAGTLALSGAGSIAGSSGVTVAFGAALDISGATTGATIKALSGAGGVALGSKALTVDQAANTTFVGGISGTGSLTKAGTGTLTLTEANLYSGATTVSGGRVELSGAGSIAGSSGVAVASGATLDISGATTGATIKALSGAGGVTLGSKTLTVDQASGTPFSGNIAGTGSLTKAGTGTLSLTGTNSYSGATTVSAGGLALVGSGSIANSSGVSVSSGATFDIGGASGPVTIQALSGAGNVTLIGQNLNLNQDSSTTFSGVITGSGSLIKAGGGTLMLSGDSSAKTGTTTVSAGKLVVGNASGGALGGNVVVGTLGTLGGSGTIGGTVNVDGTLSAGNSPGTLTINGDLVLGAASRSVFELNAPGVAGGTSNDLVVVGGDLTLGGMLDAQVAAAGYYRLFDYDGSLLGSSFASETVTSVNSDFTVTTHQVQTGITGQVNLFVHGAGQALQFWDGADAIGNGIVNGGAGTWTAGGTNWTGVPGAADINNSWQGAGAVGIFGGAGGGAVTVSGTQNFDTLQFSASGYELSGGTLAFAPATGTAATVQVDGGVTATIGSTLADGAGAIRLTKTGTGTLILSGTNLYSGRTTVAGGILSISSDSNLGLASGDLALAGGTLAVTSDVTSGRTVTLGGAGGAIDVASAQNLTLTGTVTGSGGLTKSGSGTLTLTDANNYTGGTTVVAGTLVGNAGAIRGDLRNAGVVVFDQGGDATFAGSIAGLDGNAGTMVKRGTGALTLGGASALDWTIESGGLVTSTQLFTGDAAIGAGATLTFDQAQDGRYDGQLSGSGTVAVGGGARVELTGDSSAFTGELQVLSGRLVATGTVGGGASIGAGGILAGNGSVGTTIVSAGGRASPGNSIGTVTINGNLVFEQGSFYEVEVDPAGTASDRIAVTGTATLNGGTVAHIGFGGDYRPSASYTILTAAGGVTGQFAAVSSDYAFLTPTLGYSANAVTLTLARNQTGFAQVGATANQRAVAGAAEGLGFGNAIYDALVVTDAATAQAGFDSLSGEIHASLRSAMIEDAGLVRAAALDRLRSAGSEPGVRYWLRGLGARGSIDGDGNAGRMTHHSAGVLMGADAVAGEAVQLGVFGGWQKGDVDVNSVASSADVDSWSVGFYAGGELGRFRLRAGGALGSYSGRVMRQITFADFDESAKADVGGSVAQAFGEIGYRIDLGDTRIEPVAGIAHVVLESETSREQGRAAALHVSSGSTATTFTTLGARLGQPLKLGSAQVVLDTAAAWRHAFGDRRPDARVAFAGNAAQPFTIGGTPIAKDMLSIEAGLGVALSANARLDLRYTGDVAGSASSHGGNATFALRF